MANEEPKKKKPYRISPFGVAIYAHVNKADTKFGPGIFKVDLAAEGAEAEKEAERIEAELKEFADEFLADKTPKDRKVWKLRLPFERETDDNDKPTGRIIFHFRQNENIKLKDGTVKRLKIEVRDSNDEESTALVTSGSVVRTLFTTRGFPIQTTKELSLRLDFAQVQIKELRKLGSRGGFGKVDGGYTEDHDAEAGERAEESAGPDY